MAKPSPVKSSLQHFAPHAAHPQPEGAIRVRATRTGFYGHALREKGSVFSIDSDAQLGSWMELVGDDDAPTETSAPEKEPKDPKGGKKGAKSDDDVL